MTGPSEYGATTSVSGQDTINNAHASAATNNPSSSYGENATSNDRREKEAEKDLNPLRLI